MTSVGVLYALEARGATPPDWALAEQDDPCVVKIGFSTQVEERFRTLDGASNTPLTFLWALPGATLRLEKLLHSAGITRFAVRGPGVGGRPGRGREWYCIPRGEIRRVPNLFRDAPQFVEWALAEETRKLNEELASILPQGFRDNSQRLVEAAMEQDA